MLRSPVIAASCSAVRVRHMPTAASAVSRAVRRRPRISAIASSRVRLVSASFSRLTRSLPRRSSSDRDIHDAWLPSAHRPCQNGSSRCAAVTSAYGQAEVWSANGAGVSSMPYFSAGGGGTGQPSTARAGASANTDSGRGSSGAGSTGAGPPGAG